MFKQRCHAIRGTRLCSLSCNNVLGETAIPRRVLIEGLPVGGCPDEHRCVRSAGGLGCRGALPSCPLLLVGCLPWRYSGALRRGVFVGCCLRPFNSAVFPHVLSPKAIKFSNTTKHLLLPSLASHSISLPVSTVRAIVLPTRALEIAWECHRGIVVKGRIARPLKEAVLVARRF